MSTTDKKIPRYLARADVARYLGMTSVKSLSRVILPPPDVIVGVHKGWTRETIDAWNKERPGPGWHGPRDMPNPVRFSDGHSGSAKSKSA